jgi:DNA-directed RNA polymerase alpha subunit
MEIDGERGWGGAEHDVETQLSNALDVETENIHLSNDLRPFVTAVNTVVKGSPGYDDLELAITTKVVIRLELKVSQRGSRDQNLLNERHGMSPEGANRSDGTREQRRRY